ncbi:hypothetical protein JI747_019100 [Chryseobacterium sp. RG1]|uniref:DUF5648 domain-containing protein n=1 Tax=Chryseobacterium tagetis TaxID=2801334 RepID=A0ABS8A5M9_9FLAO|nr:hypothetical protein [Chryseobacterium tagetis]MCA6069279.1 hypothetical protein [Chryseobacterium tagetis]
MFILYIKPNPGNLDNILATSSVEIQSAISQGYVIAETVGYGYSNSNTGNPVYRYYNHSINDHLYTKNWSELGSGSQGYAYEGIAFYAF